MAEDKADTILRLRNSYRDAMKLAVARKKLETRAERRRHLRKQQKKKQ